MSFATKQTRRQAKCLETVVKKIVMDVGRRVVLATPVDTGHLRSNWQHGAGAAPTGEIAGVAEAAATVGAIVASVAASPAYGVHYLVNNTPYARAIEDGHSGQAPDGMVAPTVLAFAGIVDRARRAKCGASL